MKSAVLLLGSLLALFFASQMSLGFAQRSIWPAATVSVEDLDLSGGAIPPVQVWWR